MDRSKGLLANLVGESGCRSGSLRCYQLPQSIAAPLPRVRIQTVVPALAEITVTTSLGSIAEQKLTTARPNLF